jgi:hypothetical protein
MLIIVLLSWLLLYYFIYDIDIYDIDYFVDVLLTYACYTL